MLTPSIHFHNNCDQAINFYKTALNAQVKAIHYAKDAPADAGLDTLPPHFVMHSEVAIAGTTFSLTDGSETPITGTHISFMIEYDTPEEVTAVYEKLLAGGKVVEALAPTFWSSLYGYVIDQFGVNWQVMVKA